jgi:branched-chain amino acid transport system permease protein
MTELLQQTLNGLAIGAVYVLIALGLTVVFGILGIAHFAHGSVAMFGGYLTFVFIEKLGFPFFGAMALAMVAGALTGLLIERLAYRPVRDAPHINAFIIALGHSDTLSRGLQYRRCRHRRIACAGDPHGLRFGRHHRRPH